MPRTISLSTLYSLAICGVHVKPSGLVRTVSTRRALRNSSLTALCS